MLHIHITQIGLSGLLLSIGSLVAAQSNPARQGDRAFAENRYEDARQYWQQAIEKSPDRSAALRYNQGAAAYRMDKFEEAEAAFKESAESKLPPAQRADAWYNLGNAQLRQGKYDEAIASYQNSLKIAPGHNDAKANLTYAKIKKNEQQRQQSGRGDDPKPQSAANSEAQQAQPADATGQEPQSAPRQQDPNPSAARKNHDELKELLEGIERADQKAGQKYRAKESGAKRPKPQKDW